MGNKLLALCFALALPISIAVQSASAAEKLDKVRFTYAPLAGTVDLSWCPRFGVKVIFVQAPFPNVARHIERTVLPGSVWVNTHGAGATQTGFVAITARGVPFRAPGINAIRISIGRRLLPLPLGGQANLLIFSQKTPRVILRSQPAAKRHRLVPRNFFARMIRLWPLG